MPLAQGELSNKMHEFTDLACGMKSQVLVPDYKNDYIILELDFMKAGLAFPKGTRCRQQSSTSCNV
jgi:hypothetical protein